MLILYHLLLFNSSCLRSLNDLWHPMGKCKSCRISIDFLLTSPMFFFISEQLFACANTATEVEPDEIGNLSCAGYSAGINLTQFISLSLSGLLILITTVRFTFRDSACNQVVAIHGEWKIARIDFVVFDNTVIRMQSSHGRYLSIKLAKA